MLRLKELNLDEKTIVIFCSDNGPWPYWTGPEESGEVGPLRGQKTETWEGGVRTPFIVRAPGRVPAGKTCDGLMGDVDMLSTIAAFAGADVPKDRIIDGKKARNDIGDYNKIGAGARFYEKRPKRPDVKTWADK